MNLYNNFARSNPNDARSVVRDTFKCQGFSTNKKNFFTYYHIDEACLKFVVFYHLDIMAQFSGDTSLANVGKLLSLKYRIHSMYNLSLSSKVNILLPN